MGVVRDKVNEWLPEKFRTNPKWVELYDIMAQLFEEMHTDITELKNTYNPSLMDESQVEMMEFMFNVPGQLRTLSLEKRQEFIRRVPQLASLNGVNASLIFVCFCMGLIVTPIQLYSNADYTVFQEDPGSPVEDWWISPHLQFLIAFPGAPSDEDEYNAVIEAFNTLFEEFRPIEIVIQGTGGRYFGEDEFGSGIFE